MILVGCPVYRREWILPLWFEHTRASFAEAGIEPEYIFACDRRDPSRDVIKELCPDAHYVDLLEPQDENRAEHAWANEDNLRRMSNIRNILLDDVRSLAPEVFLSLDSDILLAKPTVGHLLESLDDKRGFDAVGGKCYLAPGRDAPSWCNYSAATGMQRRDAEGVFPVDVIMAIKAMRPLAYEIDYSFHVDGEDVGWSLNCKIGAVGLGWDGRDVNKHVMDRARLTTYDKRCGF